jgi:hypothetical protein
VLTLSKLSKSAATTLSDFLDSLSKTLVILYRALDGACPSWLPPNGYHYKLVAVSGEDFSRSSHPSPPSDLNSKLGIPFVFAIKTSA